MERAKGLISDFCRSEYGSEADFSDPAKIGVAYTTNLPTMRFPFR